jgi:hypothetical protein
MSPEARCQEGKWGGPPWSAAGEHSFPNDPNRSRGTGAFVPEGPDHGAARGYAVVGSVPFLATFPSQAALGFGDRANVCRSTATIPKVGT